LHDLFGMIGSVREIAFCDDRHFVRELSCATVASLTSRFKHRRSWRASTNYLSLDRASGFRVACAEALKGQRGALSSSAFLFAAALDYPRVQIKHTICRWCASIVLPANS
jgi:hypothetical protein